jgi:hypothetical protein
MTIDTSLATAATLGMEEGTRPTSAQHVICGAQRGQIKTFWVGSHNSFL